MCLMYKVVFWGQVSEDHESECVKENLTSIFKLNEKQVEKLFSGSQVVIKKTSDKQLALRFKAAIENAGGLCKILETKSEIQQSAPAKSKIVENISKVPASKAEIKCPQCGFKQEGSTECSKCGIIFNKFHESEEMEDAPSSDVNTLASPQKKKKVNWYFEVIKKYAVFGGRAHRKEYWIFNLYNIIILLALGFIEGLFGSPGIIGVLYSLAVLIPGLAVQVRRLHDTNRSGWWLFIAFVPIIGVIIIFIFMLQDSQTGDNEYGPNPKETA